MHQKLVTYKGYREMKGEVDISDTNTLKKHLGLLSTVYASKGEKSCPLRMLAESFCFRVQDSEVSFALTD